jgi:nucleotide-binding universal stress UspA family protein
MQREHTPRIDATSLAFAAQCKSIPEGLKMASNERRGVQAFLLGSETQKVLTHSKIPVLVFR